MASEAKFSVGQLVRLTEAGKCEVFMWSSDCLEFDDCDKAIGVVKALHEPFGKVAKVEVELTLDGEVVATDEGATWWFEIEDIEAVNDGE